MSQAELTIVVGVLAGGFAVRSYLWERHRTGTLNLRRDALTVLLMVGSLVAFGYVLLAEPSLARTAVLSIALVGGSIFLIVRSESRLGRTAGILLLIALGTGLVALFIRHWAGL